MALSEDSPKVVFMCLGFALSLLSSRLWLILWGSEGLTSFQVKNHGENQA